MVDPEIDIQETFDNKATLWLALERISKFVKGEEEEEERSDPPHAMAPCATLLLFWLTSSKERSLNPNGPSEVLFSCSPLPPMTLALAAMSIKALRGVMGQPVVVKKAATCFLIMAVLTEEERQLQQQQQQQGNATMTRTTTTTTTTVEASEPMGKEEMSSSVITHLWSGSLGNLMTVIVRHYSLLDDWQRALVGRAISLMSLVMKEDFNELVEANCEELVDVYFTRPEDLIMAVEYPRLRQMVIDEVIRDSKQPSNSVNDVIVLEALYTLFAGTTTAVRRCKGLDGAGQGDDDDCLRDLYEPIAWQGLWKNIIKAYDPSDYLNRKMWPVVIQGLYHEAPAGVVGTEWGFPDDLKSLIIQKLGLLDCAVWGGKLEEREGLDNPTGVRGMRSQQRQNCSGIDSSVIQWMMNGLAGSPSR